MLIHDAESCHCEIVEKMIHVDFDDRGAKVVVIQTSSKPYSIQRRRSVL